jgi:hypothetical protein
MERKIITYFRQLLKSIGKVRLLSSSIHNMNQKLATCPCPNFREKFGHGHVNQFLKLFVYTHASSNDYKNSQRKGAKTQWRKEYNAIYPLFSGRNVGRIAGGYNGVRLGIAVTGALIKSSLNHGLDHHKNPRASLLGLAARVSAIPVALYYTPIFGWHVGGWVGQRVEGWAGQRFVDALRKD